MGPADGRYLVRSEAGGEAADDVIVFKTLGAEPRQGRSGRARRRPRRAEPEHVMPEPVPISRVTVIPSTAFGDERNAEQWLASCRSAETRAEELDYALRCLNRAVHAHRLSASDAYVFEVRAAQARRVRLGYGSGDELVEGRWREAWTLSAEDRKGGGRRAMLAPQEQVAHILSGSRPPNLSEDLLLRARLDLDQGRGRQAALQARAAHSALAAELQGETGAEHVAEQVQGRTALAERLAADALRGPLSVEQDAELQELVAELERIARRRRHA